jgi:sugar/nucleoside kinase (ribokinase family)
VDRGGLVDLFEDTVVHHRDAVSHRHRLDLVVGDLDRRRAHLVLDPLDLAPGRNAELRVQVRQRFVDRGFVTYVEDAGVDDRELGRIAAEVVSSRVGRHLHLYADAEPHLPKLAHAAGMTVSLDASDGPWWDPAAPLETVLEHADVVFANGAEAVAMTGAPDVETALALLAEHAACVVIKRGADGAIGRWGDQTASSPAEPVQTVDTTGAGDCFNAGFLYGWLRGVPLGEALTIANICAGGAVTAFGGYRGCPREAAMLRIAASRGVTVPPMGARP